MKRGLYSLQLFVGWTIVSAWIVSLTLDVVLSHYDPPATLHGLMLLVAGALFGPAITGRRRNGNGNGSSGDAE